MAEQRQANHNMDCNFNGYAILLHGLSGLLFFISIISSYKSIGKIPAAHFKMYRFLPYDS